MRPTPNQIANAIESVMTNLTAVHNDLVNCIAKSDMTPTGIIASINNNVYPISNTLYVFLVDSIIAEMNKEDPV